MKNDPQPDQPHLLLHHNSIVELHINKNGQEKVFEYREYITLAFFTKNYINWFVSIQSEFPWENDKNFIVMKGRVLAR